MHILKKALLRYLLYLAQIYAVLFALALLLVPVAMLQWHWQQCWFDCHHSSMGQYVLDFVRHVLMHEQVRGSWTYFPHLCAVALLLNRWFARLLAE
ncbi:hypothetical protein [Conchiformibius steedae]|uniref:hypothetical protein n=1 Tax=Conchiformibius steedae TaxID=153493 RepID=UPI0026EA728A|nr:hypothetical protein [Conchiformibius steedae]